MFDFLDKNKNNQELINIYKTPKKEKRADA